MERPTRLAACEPCRQLKLACDHTRPVCVRCSRSDRSVTCTYRQRPFKRRRGNLHDPQQRVPTTQELPQHLHQVHSPLSEQSPIEHTRYPNAGYLGPSSHTAIFSRLPTDNNVQDPSPAQTAVTTIQQTDPSSGRSRQQEEILEELWNTVDAAHFKDLVTFWSVKRVNLPLGGPLIESCTQTVHDLLAGNIFVDHDIASIAPKISANSLRPLATSITSSLEDFRSGIAGDNVRWETVSLALIVAGRATTDISFFPPLYTTPTERRTFQQSITNLSDRCLEFALSLDCLNDIQLTCQYESFILHSVLDGDQSYSTWRRLGDVISSMLFLGLNEKIEDDDEIPLFLAELRRIAFAQIYADDKNMAVFLGRPPRLHKNYCCFQLPGLRPNGSRIGSIVGTPMANGDLVFFGPEDQIDSVTSLRWTACCASLKEEVLEILRQQNDQHEHYAQRFAYISTKAKDLWSTLPADLKLRNSLRNHTNQTPLTHDFLLTVRLDYLQILFLLRNCAMTQRGHTTPDDEELELLQISQEMLSLVIEAIVLRNQLNNSGSSVLWKVVHYGLPAAGIICVAMFRLAFWQSHRETLDVPKIMQDLGVFVSEVQLGGLLQVGDPDYALLYRATSTIESLLRATYSSDGPIANFRKVDVMNNDLAQHVLQQQMDFVPATSAAHADLWGFEYDFWQDLGEHPSLLPTRL